VRERERDFSERRDNGTKAARLQEHGASVVEDTKYLRAALFHRVKY
jgi:hypothetical protein